MVTGQDAEKASVQYIIDGKQSMTVLKDVRTLVADAISAATAPKGTPPEVMKALRDGFKKATEDPDYIALMDKLALPRTYLDHDKFKEFLDGMEKSLESTLDLVGLLKKK